MTADKALTRVASMPIVKGKTAGERINNLHKLSIQAGKASIAAAIYAGWELTKVKQACPHGLWTTWLKQHTVITDETARR